MKKLVPIGKNENVNKTKKPILRLLTSKKYYFIKKEIN